MDTKPIYLCTDAYDKFICSYTNVFDDNFPLITPSNKKKRQNAKWYDVELKNI